jgi:alpha-tubulin suppressor-like RCC1 family protein
LTVAVTPLQLAAGDNTSAVVCRDGSLYTWGKGMFTGALGHGKMKGLRQPARVAAFDGVPVSW